MKLHQYTIGEIIEELEKRKLGIYPLGTQFIAGIKFPRVPALKIRDNKKYSTPNQGKS